eukprot:4567021-Karenia_brevis.AAC.1
MKTLSYILCAEQPQNVKIIKEQWNKPRPDVTLLAYNYLNIEAEESEKMRKAVPSIMCPEADGIVVIDVTPEQEADIRAA